MPGKGSIFAHRAHSDPLTMLEVLEENSVIGKFEKLWVFVTHESPNIYFVVVVVLLLFFFAKLLSLLYNLTWPLWFLYIRKKSPLGST